ncbi:Uncharacterized protein dnl_32350 [Desulfonema limicola]|uniref:Uncharacterized protein n=1 Tax=Desulfonema limicola TaxID=45656 RepID=A0A975B8Y8_9BACT|nr:hypothetical protein [Desulfonema limicola]QTA80918.1 Uncharacterized protein dnl_32350 [Desulfonema limicola]
MISERFWSKEHFPVVYENNTAKAVMVDIISFEKIEIILDNLMNRESETEDSILAASGMLKNLITQARNSRPSENWKAELNEL